MHLHRCRLASVILCASIALGALSGCSTLMDPGNRAGQQIAVQYATGKYIESPATPEARQARARQVKAVAENLKTVAKSDSATIAQLHELAMAKVAKANLSPSDRLLATTLVGVAVQELSQRVSIGVLDPDTRVAVSRLLDWVIAAASAYG